MNRSLKPFAFVLVGATLVACAPAQLQAGVARPAQEPAPLAIEYKVTQQGDGARVIVAGRMNMQPHHAAVVQQEVPMTPEKEELKMIAWPRDDGTYVVEVSYREVSGDGARFEWTPTLLARRGEPAAVEMSWGGPSNRAFAVTIE